MKLTVLLAALALSTVGQVVWGATSKARYLDKFVAPGQVMMFKSVDVFVSSIVPSVNVASVTLVVAGNNDSLATWVSNVSTSGAHIYCSTSAATAGYEGIGVDVSPANSFSWRLDPSTVTTSQFNGGPSHTLYLGDTLSRYTGPIYCVTGAAGSVQNRAGRVKVTKLDLQ